MQKTLKFSDFVELVGVAALLDCINIITVKDGIFPFWVETDSLNILRNLFEGWDHFHNEILC